MLCERNHGVKTSTHDEITAKLGCSPGLPVKPHGGMPEPSNKFFIYHGPNLSGDFYGHEFQLVEVDGFKETIIDKGTACGFTMCHESSPFTKFSISGEKLGEFRVYVPLIDIK